MLRKSFPGVKFPGTVYRHCTECFNMKEFFDANIDAFNIFVYGWYHFAPPLHSTLRELYII